MQKHFLLYLLVLVVFSSCSKDKIIEANVYSKLVSCEDASIANCLEIKITDSEDRITIPNDIEGFNFEEGYNYKLQLAYNEKTNTYNLSKVISKEKVAEDIRLRTWIVTSIGDISNFKEPPFLKFSPTSSTFKGYAGCNNFNGKVVFKNYDVEIGDIIMTKKVCPYNDVEQELTNALQKTKRYDVVNGILHFYSEHGGLVMTFKTEDK